MKSMFDKIYRYKKKNQNVTFNGEKIFGGHECQGYIE